MTLAILFLSEIVPKTLGAVYWKQLVSPTALFIEILIWLLYPMVWLSEHLTQLISAGKKGHIFSRDELISMARIGEASGDMPHSESRILKNLFRHHDATHRDRIITRKGNFSQCTAQRDEATIFPHTYLQRRQGWN
jgi:CBS domain containing-hemolysin-like protein